MAARQKFPTGELDPGKLEGALHPRENPDLVGHGAAELQILEAYRSGRMHHAWLLTGMEGIGKATLAFRAARFILANPEPDRIENNCDLFTPPDHPDAIKIAHGTHPNLLHIQRDWNEKEKQIPYRAQRRRDPPYHSVPRHDGR